MTAAAHILAITLELMFSCAAQVISYRNLSLAMYVEKELAQTLAKC